MSGGGDANAIPGFSYSYGSGSFVGGDEYAVTGAGGRYDAGRCLSGRFPAGPVAPDHPIGRRFTLSRPADTADHADRVAQPHSCPPAAHGVALPGRLGNFLVGN